MSIAGISSTSAFNPTSPQSLFQQRRTDFQQLSQALQSGDLAGAQAAFEALTNLGRTAASSSTSSSSSASSNSAPFRSPKLAQDFNNLGQALQSGDLAGAQQAFATLQQDIQASRRGHGHHFGGGNNQNSSQAPSANATPEIVINLNNGNSNGEQIVINLGALSSSAASGSNAPSTPAAATSDSASPTSSPAGSTSAPGASSSGTTAASGQNSAPEQIILNLGNTGGPETITLNLGAVKSGEEITINVGKLSGGAQGQTSGLEINILA